MKLHFKKLANTNDRLPIVILHGLFGSLDNWITVGKKLAENQTVYLLDQRNHGLSPHSDEFNYDVMVDDLRSFIEEEKLEKIHLVGHSMGGKTAMSFSQKHPKVLASLTVVDIAPKYYPPHHQDVLEGFHAVVPETLTSRNEALERISTVIKNSGVQLFLLKNLHRDANDSFSWKHNLPVIERNIERVGEKIEDKQGYKGSTLFIKGENSNYISDSDIEDINKMYPNSKIKSISKAGHWVHAEQPSILIEELLHHINQVGL